MKSRKLDICQWECVLDDALHSFRLLLCTATNESLHERFFVHKRRSTMGTLVPTWLSSPGPVYLKRHSRASKNEPFVDKVDIVHSTPNCALVLFPVDEKQLCR